MNDPRLPRACSTLARACRFTALAVLLLWAAPGVASAQLAPQDGAFGDPAVVSYRLTIERLEPFLAAVHAIEALGDEDGLTVLDGLSDDASVAEAAAAMDAEPRVREAMERAGMPSQEYITFMLALVRATFGSLVYTMGGEEALNEMEDEVLRENVRFYLEHEEVFEQLTTEEDGG